MLFSKWFGKKVPIGEMVLHVPHDMAWCFDKDGYYEKNVLFWFDKISALFHRPVIYDIGANYGFFSVRYSDRAKMIYAFEPVSKTYSILVKNIQKNRLTNITALRYGLSNKEESITINLYSSSGNNSMFKRRLPADHPLKFTGQETIKVVSLDAVYADQNLLPPDIVKMDIEGAELPALEGARNTIASHKPILFIEYSENTSRDAGYTCKDIEQELRQHGYEIWGLAEHTTDMKMYPDTAFTETIIANIIALPPGFHVDTIK